MEERKAEAKSMKMVPAVREAVARYLPMKQDAEALQELVRLNMGDLALADPFDLPRVKIPTGGGQKWMIPTLKGDEAKSEIECIIVGWQKCRGYWPGAFSGNTPPQCVSPDGKSGIGDPGGVCIECQFSKWGSSEQEDTNRQACKEMIRILALPPDEILPFMITLSPTSLRNFRQHAAKLVSAQKPYYGIVTIIGLEKAQNAQGIAYAKVTFKASHELELGEIEKVKAFASTVQAILQVQVTGADYEVKEGDEPKGVDL